MTKKDESQIKKIRSKSFSTIRATSPALEKILYKPIKVLDHGFIRVIDYIFKNLDIDTIYATTAPKNVNSKKVLTKLGFDFQEIFDYFLF